MSRKFRTPDYEATLRTPILLGEALPVDHLARFVVEIISQLDLSKIYAGYADRGGEAIAPEVLLGLLFYGYATGTFSSRKLEKATYENLGFRYVGGGLHPDHDTIANFRTTFLVELEDLFVQILMLAKLAGKLALGNLSLDGSKIHADASKSHAVSYGRLIQLEAELRAEVGELLQLGEQADQGEIQLPKIWSCQMRLACARSVWKIWQTRKPCWKPEPKNAMKRRKRNMTEKCENEKPKRANIASARVGERPNRPKQVREKDQYNFTDPESRIMKNSTNDGFDQHYNVQAAVDQDSLLIVATSLSNHPNDKREAEPTLEGLSPRLGQPAAAALDNGFFSEHNILAFEQRGIEPYIATGREAHHIDLNTLLGKTLSVPPDDATPLEKMAYKLSTEIGQAIYRLRKCTVEPVIGIIKEILGFRQFSLRGLRKVSGEWCLVCLAFNLSDCIS